MGFGSLIQWDPRAPPPIGSAETREPVPWARLGLRAQPIGPPEIRTGPAGHEDTLAAGISGADRGSWILEPVGLGFVCPATVSKAGQGYETKPTMVPSPRPVLMRGPTKARAHQAPHKDDSNGS